MEKESTNTYYNYYFYTVSTTLQPLSLWTLFTITALYVFFFAGIALRILNKNLLLATTTPASTQFLQLLKFTEFLACC